MSPVGRAQLLALGLLLAACAVLLVQQHHLDGERAALGAREQACQDCTPTLPE